MENELDDSCPACGMVYATGFSVIFWGVLYIAWRLVHG